MIYAYVRRFVGERMLEFCTDGMLVFKAKRYPESDDVFGFLNSERQRWVDMLPSYRSEWHAHAIVSHETASVNREENSRELMEHALGSRGRDRLFEFEQLYKEFN